MPRPDPLPDAQDEIRRRQQARARVTAILLFALVLLFFAISLAKML